MRGGGHDAYVIIFQVFWAYWIHSFSREKTFTIWGFDNDVAKVMATFRNDPKGIFVTSTI